MRLLTLVLLAGSAAAQTTVPCKPCIQAHEEFLASDALRGRGSATDDEQVAAQYIAAQLRQSGVQPFQAEGYIQTVVWPLDLSKVPMEKLPPSLARRFRLVVHDGKLTTRNVIGILPGSDPKLKHEVVLLSAHLDHIGAMQEEAVNGDAIFNGADDDASGVAAVLELARALARGRRPRRTVVFAFFGSEELGGFGDRYFLEHPPVALDSIVANLEFEMIGRPDPAVEPHTLWLTGWERTDLGPWLARNGARLVGDPHPKEDFFRRSDNYALARKGIVAQTVSSFGLHTDYHQPSDDLAHLDLAHMADAIGSMIAPVRRLANSDFKPQWTEGGKPQ